MNKIVVNNVSKKYKSKQALDDVSLTFESGKIYGLLGRNGAGKSTLINIIANRVFSNSGSISINNITVNQNNDVQESVFFMSEADYYDKGRTVSDHFKWIEKLNTSFNKERAEIVAAEFGLNTVMKLKNLSKGYQSIFKLIVALSMDTDFVFYDEPTEGLDANHRELFYKMIVQNYSESGRTIVIATHLIEEVSKLIEDVVIIDEGKLLLSESVEDLLSKGYSVSGKAEDVDRFTKDKKKFNEDVLGSLKVSYIHESYPSEIPRELDVTPISLQKMFVYLTEKGSAQHE